jgi:MFS transporter, NRE family, putaive nickel resistance protein
VLSVALTLRVTAFVLLSPLAGAIATLTAGIADRLDRKKIMVITHIFRMLIVGMLPFVTQIWQIYVLIFALNVFNAFFTLTYLATIPLVTGENDYPEAIALSSATYQLLGVLGPGIAGSVAAFIGARQVFYIQCLSFHRIWISKLGNYFCDSQFNGRGLISVELSIAQPKLLF